MYLPRTNHSITVRVTNINPPLTNHKSMYCCAGVLLTMWLESIVHPCLRQWQKRNKITLATVTVFCYTFTW